MAFPSVWRRSRGIFGKGSEKKSEGSLTSWQVCSEILLAEPRGMAEKSLCWDHQSCSNTSHGVGRWPQAEGLKPPLPHQTPSGGGVAPRMGLWDLNKHVILLFSLSSFFPAPLKKSEQLWFLY